MKTEKMKRMVLTVIVGLVVSGSVWAGWSVPVPVTEVNTNYIEASAFLSFDGLTLYFSGRQSLSHVMRIFAATRSQPSGPFGSPTQILSSTYHVEHPWVSQDNLRMYYANELPSVWVIKVSERASVNDPWSQGATLSEFSGLGSTIHPSLTADELIIVFTSPDMAGGQGSWDLWMASRPDKSSPFGNITNLTQVNSSAKESGSFMTPDGLELYFNSLRNGPIQLFKATRQSLQDPFGMPVHLSFFDLPGGTSYGGAALSSDKKALYLTGAIGGDLGDIYVSYSDSGPGPGPIAHWKLDEGSGAVAYDSAGTNDGTLVNSPIWTTGQIGGALDFDGVDDYVEVPDDTSLRFSQYNSFTISLWSKPLSAGGYLLTKMRTGGSGVFGYQLYRAGSGFRFNCESSVVGQSYVTTTSDAPDGNWHHVTAIYDNKNMEIYFNGQLQDSGTFAYDTGTTTPNNNLSIGVRLYNTIYEGYHNGTIDDIRVYDRALSAGEVEQLYYGSTGDNLLVNGDFETMELISGGWPSTFGDWSGDHSYTLPRYGDVWPYQGSQMLQFSGTSDFGCGADTESQVYQIVDVSAFAGDIAAGKATASASVYFNRLPGDAETDTEFSVDIRAFAGDPCLFPSLQDTGGMHIAEANAFIYTDGDPATWELCEAQLVLPVNTDYVVVGIVATENVYNDLAWPEFDGHCADAASLVMVIEPNVPEPSGVYHVDGVNGSDLNDGLTPQTAFATIQTGINATEDGDTVLVWPGVYTDEIAFWGEAITVKSAADAAVLQTSGGYACSFYYAEGPNTVLSNFVIRDSLYGIYLINGASPTLSNLTIVNNDFGISAFNGSDPDISNCIFWGNKYGDLFRDPVPLEAKYSWFESEVNEPNMPLSGLVSHWKLDEGAGSVAYDSAGNNDGVIYGATWTTGLFGNALDFDGVDDYIEIPEDPSLRDISSEITLMAWVKHESLTTSTPGTNIQRYVSVEPEKGVIRYDPKNDEGFHFYVSVNGSLYELWPNLAPKIDIWYYVAGTYKSGEMNFYIDGVLVVSRTDVTGTLTVAAGAKTFICSPDATATLNGIIDDVRIYDRALSAEEIEQMYEPLTSPMFADVGSGDYHLKSERGRYWPAHSVWVLDDVTSPCIDGGDPNVDPSNEPMPSGGRINMGAYGDTAYASMSEWPIKGDVNNDGRFNFMDIAILLDDWLEELGWAQ
ncbi:MAG: LamG-like jellyroll fold domain-containing protein [Planctomycetota bacterium]|jgi:parallel beta-helix repeat protein